MDGIYVAGLNATVSVPSNDEEALKAVVSTVGPVTDLFKGNPDFLAYSSGIFSTSQCAASFTVVLLIIGYG